MTPAIHPEDDLEYTRQMLVYGDVTLDVHGRVVQREEPEYWQMLRVGGRRFGKTSMQRHLEQLHEQVQRVIDKTDQLHRMVKGWRMAPQQPAVPEIGPVRWPGGRNRSRAMEDWEDFSAIMDKTPAFPTATLDLLDLLIEAKESARYDHNRP